MMSGTMSPGSVAASCGSARLQRGDRTMKAIWLAIGLGLIPAFAIAAEKPFTETARGAEAWWLRTRYHPFGKEVRGIPLAKVHSTWCKANEFRKDLFPKELAASFEG